MAAAEVEARLRQELMVKESEARVAASVAAASAATTAAAPARRPMADEEEDITGEVPTEVIFNHFAEALRWIIASFLRWLLCHHLDNLGLYSDQTPRLRDWWPRPMLTFS